MKLHVIFLFAILVCAFAKDIKDEKEKDKEDKEDKKTIREWDATYGKYTLGYLPTLTYIDRLLDRVNPSPVYVRPGYKYEGLYDPEYFYHHYGYYPTE